MVDRVPIPKEVVADVLFASHRTCCVCRVPGKPHQIHHIDDDPSNNDPANLAVLCLECHNETQVHGGFGRRLDAAQVLRYRDQWLLTVQERRKAAMQVLAAATAPEMTLPKVSEPFYTPNEGLYEYIDTLPELRRLAYAAARPKWDTGVTARMMEASYQLIDSLASILVNLAGYYPPNHFDKENPRDYFSELISTRFRWHRYHNSTAGEGWSGTIVGPLAAGGVTSDVEAMIEDMVLSLTVARLTDETGFNANDWKRRWHAEN